LKARTLLQDRERAQARFDSFELHFRRLTHGSPDEIQRECRRSFHEFQSMRHETFALLARRM
jgi:hypothetical protein